MLDLDGGDVWLTSFWGFDPARWGCIGFSETWRRAGFLMNSKGKTLVAIYVTKGRGPENQRGKVVGTRGFNTYRTWRGKR